MEPTLYNEWSEQERKIFKDWLISHLKYGPVTVTFKKKDGTLREMNCTLKSELAKDYEKKTERTKTVNEDTCPVFDLDKQEWRSFRYDAIRSVTLTV